MANEIQAAMAQYPGKVLYYTTRGLVHNLLPGEKVLAKVIPEPIQNDTPQIGWYRFTDDSYAPNPIDGKVIKGVVAYFENNIPQSISMNEETLAYCEECFKIGARSKSDGAANTKLIVEVSRHQGVRAPAAEWAVAQAGFIPASKDWMKIRVSLNIINASLSRIGAPIIDPKEWYWSSTEYYYSDFINYAWLVRPSDGFLGVSNKYNTGRVRCVLN